MSIEFLWVFGWPWLSVIVSASKTSPDNTRKNRDFCQCQNNFIEGRKINQLRPQKIAILKRMIELNYLSFDVVCHFLVVSNVWHSSFIISALSWNFFFLHAKCMRQGQFAATPTNSVFRASSAVLELFCIILYFMTVCCLFCASDFMAFQLIGKMPKSERIEIVTKWKQVILH